MKAIILAAGIGSRIRPLTDDSPKSLLKVGDTTILERMLRNIEEVGISEVAIITGYLEHKIKDFISATFSHMNISYIPNEKYLDTNTGYSLLLARDFVGKDDFVKFDADVVFEKEVLQKLLDETTASALCIDTNIHLDKEEVKVRMENGNKVIEVGKKLDPHSASGESIGIEKIGGKAVDMLFTTLHNLMKNPSNHKEYYDDSYTTLVANGSPFAAVDITGLKWVEIDTHEDYAKAHKLFS